MAEQEDKLNRHVDALEAMAAGEQAEPVEGAETEPAAGPSSGLMLLFEDRESEASADDALSDMAAAARGDDSAPAPDDALDQIAAASTPAEPTGRQVRAARFEASSRRVYAYNAKRLMIPLLVVVGVILLILSVVTLVVLWRIVRATETSVAIALHVKHQIEVMEMISSMVKRNSVAAILAMHDLNLATRFSGRMVMLNAGKVFCDGDPQQVITAENIRSVYGVEATISLSNGHPYILPTRPVDE